MEVVACAALTTLWWMSSASIFLPLVILLKYSKSFRNKWFSWVFSRCVGPVFEPKLLPFRKQCFDLLKQNLVRKDDSAYVRILEIGIGSGANLRFYPERSSLVAVDMNPSFEKYFVENQKKYPQVKLDRTILSMAEDMHEVEDNSMDVVASTYVLCSVEDVEAVLSEVKRVLKPGGLFVFLEHVSYPNTQWSSTVQKFVAPLWSLYFAGCCPHRNIAESVDNAGFSKVSYKHMEPSSLMLFVRPHIIGIVTK